MRKFFVSAFVLAALLVFASSGLALEKTAVQANLDRGDWNAGTSSCSIVYYNICTGWVWVWSGWAANSVLGTVYDTCCDPANESTYVTGTYFYYATGAPPGYGFTGTVSLEGVDGNDCPTGAIASQPVLPVSGWNFFVWGNDVPNRFAQVHVLADEFNFGTPVNIYSDGAQACGICFPTTRTTSSYTWGTTGSPLCPGFNLNDGACNVEWLAPAQVVCNTIAVEDDSWGSIKNLYR
jgi:hypothetical protein